MSRRRPDPSYDPTPDAPLGIPVPTTTAADALALVIAWSRTEPERVGERALIEPRSMVIGRGGPRPEDNGPRVEFAAVRPGRTLTRGPLGAPTLSRLHARLWADHEGVEFVRTGKGHVELDGVRVDDGQLGPGSTLLLANELLVVCERRPAQPPDAALARTPEFPFGDTDPSGITGESAMTWRLRDQVRFAAGSAAPLLVLGAPGSGKDLVTRAVHSASAHRDRPYLVLGGATLTRADIDALQSRDDAPFVVIDEVGDVAPEVQPFLSRLISLVGSQPPPRLRIVATNSAPLNALPHAAAAAPGAAPPTDPVRADLASRFIHLVRVPGLDERRSDVPLLARALLREIAAEQPEVGQRFFDDWSARAHLGAPRLSPALVDRLVRHRWHAHVRELTALLWTAMTTASEGWLDATPEVLAQLDAIPDPGFADPGRLDADAIRDALERAHGKVAQAARLLGLKNRWVLYRVMEKLDIRTQDR